MSRPGASYLERTTTLYHSIILFKASSRPHHKGYIFGMALEIGCEYVTITAENRNSEKHHVLK
jgi:hypothetical protein